VKHPDAGLRIYCELLAAALVSVTSIREPERLWEVHVEDALTAVPVLRRLAPRSAVDVGSGGGSPGIPLAVVTGVETTLLEATGTKCAFLRRAVEAVGAPCAVVHDRSEQFARGAGRDAFDCAVARALAPPPGAAELCLPLVRAGGHAILYTAATDISDVERAAAHVGGAVVETVDVSPNRRLIVLAKTAPTPDRFPRRPGMATTRPLVRVRSRP
jgi:16S rRNA (guanine527-N7)-methyltransferase